MIAAMPGWKRALGERLDRLIVHTVPDLHKAVRWNQPFYGNEGDGWFLAFRCYTRHVQPQFFRGSSLDPVPPKASNHPEVRTSTSTRTTSSTNYNSSPGSSGRACSRGTHVTRQSFPETSRG
jgi:hypothetical protein